MIRNLASSLLPVSRRRRTPGAPKRQQVCFRQRFKVHHSNTPRMIKPVHRVIVFSLMFSIVGYGDEIDHKSKSQEIAAHAVVLDAQILSGFLREHCTRCHGADEQNGETRLDNLTLKIGNSDTALHWQEVLDVLNLGEMPPEDEPAPRDDQLRKVLAHLTEALTDSKKRLSETGGDVALRRINRREYQNTIDDLFGLRVPEDLLPPDDIAEGYDTVGHDQQFSSYHFDDYFSAAKRIVKVALDWVDQPREKADVQKSEPERFNAKTQAYIDDYDKKMARIKKGATYKDLGLDDEKQFQLFIKRYDDRAGGRKRYLEKPFADQGVFLLEGRNHSRAIHTNGQVDPRAFYKYRVIAGLNGSPPPIRQFVKMRVGERTAGYLKIEGSPQSPVTHELEFRPFLTDGRSGFDVTESKAAVNIKIYYRNLREKGKEPESAIWVDRMEREGPLYNQPALFESRYMATLGNATPETGETRPKQKHQNDELAVRFLNAFMTEAFRHRQPAPDFALRVHNIYKLHRDNGRTIKQALETPLAMILSSPSFLYLMENSATGDDRSLSDQEFANRISHFLWSRPADESLREAAADGKLSDPQVLRAHIDRMLQSPASWALSEGFFSRWADLERFDNIAIDETQHVMFNSGIRESARLEVQHFFDTMVKENLSLTELIDSDFVVVNDLLASHYGLDPPGVGAGFQKVPLPSDSPRGGLLGMTAFLTMGSNGERSSPIIRGALIMEKFLHRKPSPPPPNVPELALASDEPLAVKEIIDLHRKKAQCASCHSSFDPLGFGLENFDLLGQWRDYETVGNIGKKSGKGRPKQIPIRAEGVFPSSGYSFKNLAEFRAGLMQERQSLTRSITEGLLSYGLGRHIEFADGQIVDEICAQAESDDLRIGDLVFAIVNHPVFRRADR